ncbi:MAG TPA: tRNA (N(6)-L-threonylcarbamoyladenosine(37)-C(2))-methylthiotransferase MtaB, partial [Spirochaetia bacterium]|nr:tRNA (N(6)-L-threonylcarbamoyladenosine(37)-C(2))-methylthiotransferase MtaB [Spirochaetia bacterium]
MRIGFYTFGCKLNQFETDALVSALRGKGCLIAKEDQPADAYVVNTCTVTARADHKARALVRSLARRHPHSTIVVTGCSAQVEARRLAALADNVVVVPQDRKDRLVELPRLLASGRAPSALLQEIDDAVPPGPFALPAASYGFHARAYLKIQDGCDCSCAYCRVPMARGRSVCLDAEEAIRRAAYLEASGFREIVLTGVNVSSYRFRGMSLGGLLRCVLSATDKARLRVSSLEPEAVSPQLAAELAHPRVCPHFHLPVQS